jgi:stage V sporulation protein S
MNRFFSKLDLRDIKISPEGSRFPPDADEAEEPAQDAVSSAAPDGPIADVPVAEVTNWESPTFSPLVASPNGVSHEVESAVEPAPEPEVTSPRAGYEVDGVLIASDGEVLKVSARSRPSAVAGAIAGVVREAGRAEVQAIGAGATNQAVKAVAIARDYLRETGIEAVCLPAFIDVTIENEDRTAIRLVIEPR